MTPEQRLAAEHTKCTGLYFDKDTGMEYEADLCALDGYLWPCDVRRVLDVAGRRPDLASIARWQTLARSTLHEVGEFARQRAIAERGKGNGGAERVALDLLALLDLKLGKESA